MGAWWWWMMMMMTAKCIDQSFMKLITGAVTKKGDAVGKWLSLSLGGGGGGNSIVVDIEDGL